MKTVDDFLDALVFARDPGVLAQMVKPRVMMKQFDIPPRLGNILKHPPAECAIPPPDGAQLLHRVQEGLALPQFNLVFDRDEDWPPGPYPARRPLADAASGKRAKGLGSRAHPG